MHVITLSLREFAGVYLTCIIKCLDVLDYKRALFVSYIFFNYCWHYAKKEMESLI
ncbi:protein of unknown function [Maridesulfovibrio hydrothermalis AM13 = DSM 14728]|uniref:Uncharacterized protein n=1 Tax=Maridesulfovibrio hydrothermalis AM13 = DSM 14728 TaxID=1121451 RepID=L0RGX4_9BACT|nr:protein of unknown function [Maridesulfovibrio hydrothermalis AM13 = DSM 14728]